MKSVSEMERGRLFLTQELKSNEIGGNEEMKYTVCERCGAHLDNGERCDCNENNNGDTPDDNLKERAKDNDRN